MIGPIHDLGVDPFKVECIDEGLAHALVFKFPSAGVEIPALRCRIVVGDGVTLHPSLAGRRKLVARRPDPRNQLFAKEVAFTREALESNVAIAIILVPDDVKIVLSAGNRQVGAPPVRCR